MAHKKELWSMTVAVLILALMLFIPVNSSQNIVEYALHRASGFTYDIRQYEPVVAFKEKYPDYTVMEKPEYPRGDKNTEIIYSYTNSSLNRTETLSVNGDHSNPSFSQRCFDGNGNGVDIHGADLAHFTKNDIIEFECANYSIDSETLQKLHDTKIILEQSNFPIKYVKYDYADQSLKIRLYEFPKDNYEEKINEILNEQKVRGEIEYQGFGIGRRM